MGFYFSTERQVIIIKCNILTGGSALQCLSCAGSEVDVADCSIAQCEEETRCFKLVQSYPKSGDTVTRGCEPRNEEDRDFESGKFNVINNKHGRVNTRSGYQKGRGGVEYLSVIFLRDFIPLNKRI